MQNATSVGFVDPASGEYKTVTLNEGQRDKQYTATKLTNCLTGRGLAVFGQKTLNANALALDRVKNIVIETNYTLNNDDVTRQNADVVDVAKRIVEFIDRNIIPISQSS